MNKFNFEIVKETAEKIATREPESPLKKALDYLTFCQQPLEDNTRSKKMVDHQLEDLALIDRGRLEHVGVRGGHGCNGESFWEKRERVEMAARARAVGP
jgi:hypothetical protein